MATRRHDQWAGSLLTLGHVLRELGAFEDALRVLRRINALAPDHINAQAAYALTLFFKEDWAQAWQAFDVRFKFPDAVPNVTLPRKDASKYAARPWSQGPAAGNEVGAQGLGDAIQSPPQLAATGSKACG